MPTILLVEDRPTDREFLSTLLKAAGYAVVEASDGVEGLRLAERAPPDLVISNILMPTVDGYGLVQRMRKIDALSRTPVLFYSATYHEREARTLARRCGADVITKPTEPAAFLAKVREALAREASRLAPPPSTALFTQDHVQLASATLASKIEELATSEQRMAAIVEVARQIAAERDRRAILTLVCAAARDVTLALHAAIGVMSNDKRALALLATSGIETADARRMSSPDVNSLIMRTVLGERRPARLRNPSGRPEALGLPADHPLTFCCLIVPIATPHEVHGYLELRNKLGRDEFTEADEDVALTLATHAAIAYENARLYDDLRGHAETLELEVAERRRAEAALLQTKERTDFALAAARTGVWEWDLGTDRMAWSDTTSLAFGLGPGEAPQTSDEFFALLHPEDQGRIRDMASQAVRAHTDLAAELRTIWRDGSLHWIDTKARVDYDADSTPRRILGTTTDITDRKLLEEQFRQAQKMEAIGQLAGGVAHDFNNLLTAIRGYAVLLQESLDASDRRQSDVLEIVKAADRAAGLTRQLLAFSRKQVLQPKLVDLNALVTDMSNMLRRVIGEDIELTTTLASTLAPVHADPGQIEQILMNLVVNARDAMPRGGRLTIETSNIDLDASYALRHVVVRPGHYVMLAVSDTGVGMDAKTQQHVFEPFFTTKERGRGTGLGLATVYGIVKQSGGYVWVYSEPGRGATFKIYLPQAATGGIAEQAVTVTAAPSTGNETVLLVEDEQAVRFLSRVLLERGGYRVLDAASPREAEDLFRDHGDQIDLLVTDVILPGSSGPALFTQLSAQRSELKVLFMSGYTDDSILHQGGVPADVVFLQKPFSADGLLAKVRQALDT